MAPRLIKEGKIQILGQTANSVIYAVASDTKTGWAKDSPSALKGGTVWYEGHEALGPGKGIEESDERARKEAAIYEVLGPHPRILTYLGLETALLAGARTTPMARAARLERAPHSSVRDSLLHHAANPPQEHIRLQLALQFAEGVAHIHQRGIVWGDLSVRNALLFDGWRIKLGDFADSDAVDDYPRDWYGAEMRYCPPGSDRPQCHDVGTMNREMVEWKVPYGAEASDDKVTEALVDCKWPQLTSGNPAGAIIRRCWGYGYESSSQVVDNLKSIL
jgi:serine/threonine protein kinase